LKVDSKSEKIKYINRSRNGSKIVIATDDNYLKVYKISRLIQALQNNVGIYDQQPFLVYQCGSNITNIALPNGDNKNYSELCCYSTSPKTVAIMNLDT